MNIIIKKWIEPYVLLETAKKHFEMEDLTFDGFSKIEKKNELLKKLKNIKGAAFGLYMKNVNKFYFFSTEKKLNIEKFLIQQTLNFNNNDYETTEDINKPIELVDIGKAEAGIIIAD